MRRLHSTWLAGLVLSLAMLTAVVSAQDDDGTDWVAQTRRLSRRLRAHPDDTAAQCRLGWAYYQTRSPDIASSTLDAAIAALGAPTTRALTERLGACLYSRGRVAESTDVATAIPFYERSIALRPNAVVSARLDGARALVAARWTAHESTSPTAADAALTTAIGHSAQLLDRYTSATAGEIQVLDVDDGTIVVAARGSSADAWVTAVAWDGTDCEAEACGPGRSWLEAPLAGERARIVVVYALHEREVMGSGPYLWATLAVGNDGRLRLVSRDARGRSV